MTTALFAYPQSAAFGRVLPKNRIYHHASVSTAVKQLFSRQVAEIVWQYKLAPDTLNIARTSAVPEIQVFSLALKTGAPDTEKLLRLIDRAIPFPILFTLKYEGKVQPVAAFKRPRESDAAKWIVSEYFAGDWSPAGTPREPLPMALDLESLYGFLLAPLMPYPARPGERPGALVARMECVRRKERALVRCKARLHKEKQFNRRIAINAELRILKQELEGLTR